MTDNRQLLWLHRVGYVTTAIVLLLLLARGWFAVAEWSRSRQDQREYKEETRTHDGPLRAGTPYSARTEGVLAFGNLPPLAREGLRFAAMPSFGPHHYHLWLAHQREDSARGLLVIGGGSERRATARPQISFVIPQASYETMTRRLDALADGWGGSSSGCLDGTYIAFERSKAGRVTSGAGGCMGHYHELGVIVLQAVRPYLAAGTLAVDDGWFPIRPPAPRTDTPVSRAD